MFPKNVFRQVSFAFEKYVKAVFVSLAKKEGKTIPAINLADRSNTCIPDLCLPEGLEELGLRENTVVEIVASDNQVTIKRVLKRWSLRAELNCHIAFVIEGQQVPVLSFLDRSKRDNLRIITESSLHKYNSLVKTEYLFYQQSKGNGILTSPSKFDEQKPILPKNFGDFSSKDFDSYQEKTLSKAKIALQNQNSTALLLGNGVSISVGSRSWATLNKELCYLFGRYLVHPSIDREVIGTTTYSDSLLAHYACLRNLKKSDYFDTIYQALYETCVLPASSSSLMNGATNFAIRHKPTILTFNYDSLFEETMTSLGASSMAIWNPKRKPSMNQKNAVYHIHGYLEHNKKPIPTNMENSLILDENDYFNFYGTSSDWRRQELDNAIETKTCFLVGLSLSDTFLRARFRQTQSKEHYAFLCSQGLPKIPDLLIISSIFYDMNIEVIWRDSFSEISKLLQTL